MSLIPPTSCLTSTSTSFAPPTPPVCRPGESSGLEATAIVIEVTQLEGVESFVFALLGGLLLLPGGTTPLQLYPPCTLLVIPAICASAYPSATLCIVYATFLRNDKPASARFSLPYAGYMLYLIYRAYQGHRGYTFDGIPSFRFSII